MSCTAQGAGITRPRRCAVFGPLRRPKRRLGDRTVPFASAGLFDIATAFDEQRLLADVSTAECERYRGLQRRPRRARQYLASRWLLRAHLAPQLGLQPVDVPLRDNPNGPPLLPDSRFRLGLSHSGALCLCISSMQARVGCDVESHRSRRRPHAIATQFFHPAEAAHLNSANEERARRDFYRLWTLKEAAQKALGRGLAGGLRAPAFTLKPALCCFAPPSREPWTFASCTLGDTGERYSAALAIAGVAPPAGFAVYAYTATTSGPVSRRSRMRWDIAGVTATAVEPRPLTSS